MTDPLLPFLVEPDQLEQVLGAPSLLVVDVGEEAAYAQHHVPGAVNLPYRALVEARPPAMGLLPGDGRLSEVVSYLGITPDTHVVAYDNEGNGRAARLLWTLDAIGHPRSSLLDGGLHAWANEGHPTEQAANAPKSVDCAIARHSGAIADKTYILGHLDDTDVVVLDVRSPAEYAGQDVRAARGGHIPGAVNLEWTRAIDRERNLRLKPEAALREMLEGIGATPDKEVIVHCQTHHRSAHTYAVLKSLGYPRIRGYDGSWSEWGNDPDTPIET
jgi:thiosulfate/3-mercaptopyruvate sulfurtransferase